MEKHNDTEARLKAGLTLTPAPYRIWHASGLKGKERLENRGGNDEKTNERAATIISDLLVSLQDILDGVRSNWANEGFRCLIFKRENNNKRTIEAADDIRIAGAKKRGDNEEKSPIPCQSRTTPGEWMAQDKEG